MNKKIVEYGNAIVERTGVTISQDEVDENFIGSIENLISFIPNSVGNLVMPLVFLFILFLAASFGIGYCKQALWQAIILFLFSLIIILPGGIILGMKRSIKGIAQDASGVVLYALDLTQAVYQKAEQDGRDAAAIQDTFALIMCFMVIPGMEKVLDTLFGPIKFILSGLLEKLLFSITKMVYAVLSDDEQTHDESGKAAKETVRHIEEIRGNITKIVKKGTSGASFIFNIQLAIILILGIPPLTVIFISVL